MSELPDPKTAPELFDGLLTRRVLAYVVDVVIISIIALVAFVIAMIAGFLTFGLAWIGAPVIVLLSIALYYALTLGSRRRATFGMGMFDVVLTPTQGLPLEGWRAVAHPLLFWVTIWAFWPLLLIGLFTPRRQLLHDLVLGTMMVRRSPMERHWAQFQAA